MGSDRVQNYYDSFPEEYSRLDESEPPHHRLEFERTFEYLTSVLPEDDSLTILDAGGAAGKYTDKLAELGHTVHLCDLSRGQLDSAYERHRNTKSVHISQQSITDLAYPDDYFDMTLCLGGPLSHILERDAQERAVSELQRVTAVNKDVIVSVMSRHSALLLAINRGVFFDKLDELSILTEVASTGKYEGYDMGFTDTYFYTESELRTLLEDNELEVENSIGLESVTSILSTSSGDAEVNGEIAQVLKDTVDIVEESGGTPPDMSSHFLIHASVIGEGSETDWF